MALHARRERQRERLKLVLLDSRGKQLSSEELAQFLAARIHRPIVGHYAAASQFQIAAYHRRALGGTNGTLEFGQDAIRFVSDKPADSRTWLYRDIETIGRPDPFRFRVSTVRETYVLELKAQISTSTLNQILQRGIETTSAKGRALADTSTPQFTVGVTNPGQGGGDSPTDNSGANQIIPTNAAPVLLSISPTSITLGTNDLTLTLNGNVTMSSEKG